MVKKFDLVYGRDISLGIVVSDTLLIPYFDTCVASNASCIPIDISNPESYDQEWEVVIIYDFSSSSYKIVSVLLLHVFEQELTNGYVPFDIATSKLKEVLSLIAFAEKLYGDKKTNFLQTLKESL